MTKFSRTDGATPRPYNDEGPGVLPGPSERDLELQELDLPAPLLLRPEGLRTFSVPGRHGIAHTGDARLLVDEEGLRPHDVSTIHHSAAKVNTQFQRYRLARAHDPQRATQSIPRRHKGQRGSVHPGSNPVSVSVSAQPIMALARVRTSPGSRRVPLAPARRAAAGRRAPSPCRRCRYRSADPIHRCNPRHRSGRSSHLHRRAPRSPSRS